MNMKPKFRNMPFPRGKVIASRVTALLWMTLMLLLLPASGSAQFVYTSYDGEISITGCTNCADSMVIPEMIDGLPVEWIKWGAFSGCPGMTNISLPDTMIYSLGFVEYTNLQAIEVDPANPVYSSFDGVLFNHDQTELLECPAGRGGSFTVPDTVTNLVSYGFTGCNKLTSVTLGAGLTSIPSGAVEVCSSLTNVTIPDTVTNIGAQAFWGCEQLPSITLPPQLPYIAEATFYNCTNLSAVAIPNSVTVISNLAFAYCRSLTNLSFLKVS
jgi:BspA type Leucine rich repeat region (6 copies)